MILFYDKCPEFKGENLNLIYTDRCHTTIIQLSGKVTNVSEALMFEYNESWEALCIDCDIELEPDELIKGD